MRDFLACPACPVKREASFTGVEFLGEDPFGDSAGACHAILSRRNFNEGGS
jgi:hypothetical protein